ncbi:MAG: lipid-A-disaccharide synthase [Candidatus Omnitrophota bacterium]
MDRNILIIAGEPSGDMRAAELLKELRGLLSDASFWGIGGDRMKAEGVELIEHIKNFSLVGVWEVAKQIFKIRKQFNSLACQITARKPRMAILVDYPGFNLKVAAFLRKNKIPVVYYIIPQVWAWGKWRIKALKKFTDKILVLFDFENDLLTRHGINCDFVGHPIIEKVPPLSASGAEKVKKGITISLLPGSRGHEIKNLLPVMLETAEKIAGHKPGINFIIAESSNIDRALYDEYLSRHKGLRVSILKDDTFTCLEKSDAAIVTSGTATLETAVMKKPFVIIYKASPLTYILFRLFAKVRFIGLVNIIAGKEIVPELLQEKASPDKISSIILDVLDNPAVAEKQREELGKIRAALGEKGAPYRAAVSIVNFIKSRGI